MKHRQLIKKFNLVFPFDSKAFPGGVAENLRGFLINDIYTLIDASMHQGKCLCVTGGFRQSAAMAQGNES